MSIFARRIRYVPRHARAVRLAFRREGCIDETARRFVDECAGGELAGQDLADLKLVVTELVDNAYLHGDGRIWLKLNRREDQIRIE